MRLRKFFVPLAGIALCLGLALKIPSANAQTLSSWAKGAFSPSIPKNKPAEALPARTLLAPHRLPFSFTYAGKSSRDLLPRWKARTEAAIDTPAGATQTVRWSDPDTRLSVVVSVTAFKDFPAVEWLLRFENTGTRDTPILEDVHALDLLLGANHPGHALELHRIAGSDAMKFAGWQRLNAEYAAQFGVKAPNWPPPAAEKS